LNPIGSSSSDATTTIESSNNNKNKILQKAQKAERQWYRDNILIPQKEARAAEKSSL
jgi:hypothetical protein